MQDQSSELKFEAADLQRPPPVAGRLSAELLGRHRQNEEISAKFVERTTEVLSVHQPSIDSAHIHIFVEEYWKKLSKWKFGPKHPA